MATTRKQSGYLIQGSFGNRGNFELVIPCGRRGLAHYWRDNDTSQFPWHGPSRFGSSTVAATSLIPEPDRGTTTSKLPFLPKLPWIKDGLPATPEPNVTVLCQGKPDVSLARQ